MELPIQVFDGKFELLFGEPVFPGRNPQLADALGENFVIAFRAPGSQQGNPSIPVYEKLAASGASQLPFPSKVIGHPCQSPKGSYYCQRKQYALSWLKTVHIRMSAKVKRCTHPYD